MTRAAATTHPTESAAAPLPGAASRAAATGGSATGGSAAGCAADLLLRWPRGVPLAALVSGGELHAQNAWSIFARPKETVVIPGTLAPAEAIARLEAALARTPRVVPVPSRVPSSVPSTDARMPVPSVPSIGGAMGQACSGSMRTPPFDGGWVVALGYSLGACFEPRMSPAHRASPAPHAVLLWCEDAWCLDHSDGSLHAVGTPPPLTAEPSAEGTGAEGTGMSLPWRLTALEPDTSDSHYAASVARTVEYIRAGDAFQANVARRFSARIAGDLRTFAHAAITENRAWFGASIDLPGTFGTEGAAGEQTTPLASEHLVSMSPELFLRVRPDGTMVTRPIKGTRPSSVDARELADSEKDAAELAMIVDLMRNDLGRIAELGSVQVTSARVLETHRTVHHGVAEISARLRDDVDWTGMLAATFPPGSVTGAPKIRAMQIIEELEPHTRGFYCGAIGFISRSGHAALSVAIRTAQIGPAPAACPVGGDEGTGKHAIADRTTGEGAEGTGKHSAAQPTLQPVRPVAYHAGCGIVVESDPQSEVEETHAKARAIAQLAVR